MPLNGCILEVKICNSQSDIVTNIRLELKEKVTVISGDSGLAKSIFYENVEYRALRGCEIPNLSVKISNGFELSCFPYKVSQVVGVHNYIFVADTEFLNSEDNLEFMQKFIDISDSYFVLFTRDSVVSAGSANIEFCEWVRIGENKYGLRR